jgi:hypothetical protein
MMHGNKDDRRLYADHTYRDFSCFLERGGVVPKHKKSENNFPARLHKLISDPSNSHIIAWMPHGRAWKILDKKLLLSVAAPKYFSQTKFPSFTRQLNGWGFKRLHQKGADFGCYYHQCFLRGLPKLTGLIERESLKGVAPRPHAAGEPNFYRVAEQFPLPPSPASEDMSKGKTTTSGSAMFLPSNEESKWVSSETNTTAQTSISNSFSAPRYFQQHDRLFGAQRTSSTSQGEANSPVSAADRPIFDSGFNSVHNAHYQLSAHEQGPIGTDRGHNLAQVRAISISSNLSAPGITPSHMNYPSSHQATRSYQNPLGPSIQEQWSGMPTMEAVVSQQVRCQPVSSPTTRGGVDASQNPQHNEYGNEYQANNEVRLYDNDEEQDVMSDEEIAELLGMSPHTPPPSF